MNKLHISLIAIIFSLFLETSIFSSEIPMVNKYIAATEILNTIGGLLTKYHDAENKELLLKINKHMQVLKKQNLFAFQNIDALSKNFFDETKTRQDRENAYNQALSFIRLFTNKVLADTIKQLQKNIIKLDQQEKLLTKAYQEMDQLVIQKIITQEQAILQKEQLQKIFEKNKRKTLEQASYVTRLSNKVKSPFQWAYNKVFDEQSSYLQRAGYALAIAAGTVAVGLGMYYGAAALKGWLNPSANSTEQVQAMLMAKEELSVQKLELPVEHEEVGKQEVIVPQTSSVTEQDEKGKGRIFFAETAELTKEASKKSVDEMSAIEEEDIEAKYPEFYKFTQKYAPSENIKKFLESQQKVLMHSIYTGAIKGEEGKPVVFAKGDDIARIVYAERLRNFIEQEGLTTVTVPEKYIFKVGNEWRAFAKAIGKDPNDKGQTLTDVQVAELDKIARLTGFMDWSGNFMLDPESGKIAIIDTELTSFIPELSEGPSLTGSTKYDQPDINMEKALEEYREVRRLLQKKGGFFEYKKMEAPPVQKVEP